MTGHCNISLPTLAVLEHNAILATGIYPPPAMQGMMCTVDATKKSEPAPRRHRDWGNEILEIQQEKWWKMSFMFPYSYYPWCMVGKADHWCWTVGKHHYRIHPFRNWHMWVLAWVGKLLNDLNVIWSSVLYDSRISCHHTGLLGQTCTIAGFA